MYSVKRTLILLPPLSPLRHLLAFSTTSIPTATTSATYIPTVSPSATYIPTASPSATSIPTTTTSVTSIPTTTTSPTSIPTTTTSATSIPTSSQESILYVLKKLSQNPPKALQFFDHTLQNPNLSPLLSSSAFTLILRILAPHRAHLPDFWRLLNAMSSLRHSLDQPAYLTLLSTFKNNKFTSEAAALSKFYSKSSQNSTTDSSISAAIDIILTSDTIDDEFSKKITSLNLDFSENITIKILPKLRDHPSKALAFFRWLPTKQGSTAHNVMARVLARDGCTSEFWDFVEGMRSQELEMDIDTYIKLLRQFFKKTMMEDAVRLYEFMMDGPFKPSVQDCGMLLRKISLGPAPDLDLVWRVVRKYEASGNAISKVVYDGIHRSLTSNGKFEEAEEILGRMREEGFEPDNITYSQLVHGLCKVRRFGDARKVFDEMEERQLVPDLKTWTVLIQGHCEGGEVDKGLELLMKMVEKGCVPDADVVDVLVKGLCGDRRAGGAYTFVAEMVSTAEVRPWQATYKFLIQELLGEKKLEEALDILGMMKKHNFPPFADPFGPYISKFGAVEDARELLKKLSVKTYPTHTAYLHLFKAFFNEGRYTEAQDLLYKCPHHIRKHAEISNLFGSVKVDAA